MVWLLLACANEPKDWPLDLDGTSYVGEVVSSKIVTIHFEGLVATVADRPLGLGEEIRDTPVSGSFSYDLTQDDSSGDNLRGNYRHYHTTPFQLQVAERSIQGTSSPTVTVENLDPDTFRFEDQGIGGTFGHEYFLVDGREHPDLSVIIAITDDSGAAFTDDALPPEFPMLDIVNFPHTAALEDDGGTLLMQWTVLSQTGPD